MSIDFRAESNRYTYATRSVDSSWINAIAGLVQPQGKTVLDIGCGGGIYSRAWVQLGAKQVIGIDFSESMLQAAFELTRETGTVWFVAGDAAQVPLVGGKADIVFERALIHHISDQDLPVVLKEVFRLLKPGGVYLIQDRTLDDVQYPSSRNHIRGFFFEVFPRLLEVEKARRRGVIEVESQLLRSGFTNIGMFSFWEVRRRYENVSGLANDLRKRNGRSILHELTDSELQYLIEYINRQFFDDGEIVEKDRWTIWYAQKPA
jgi:ubiquinone/menaquinone biosynthesis C-methylase UbiE